MAVLTNTPTVVAHDIKGKTLILNSAEITANNDDWNLLNLTMPQGEWKEAIITNLSLLARNAATVPVITELERCRWSVQRNGSSMQIDTESSDIHFTSNDVDAPTPDAWFSTIRNPWPNVTIYPGDLINIFAPPCDDNVSATGDYFVEISLRVIKY